MGVATRHYGQGSMAEIRDGKPENRRTSETTAGDVPELARRAVAGEQSAFATLCARFEKAVFLTAYRLMGNEADAMEVVQNTFLRGYRGLRTYDPSRSFRTWLLAIAVNEARRLLSRRTKDPNLSVGSGPELAGEPAARNSDHVARAELKDALDALATDERAAFVLRYVESRSPGEVAQLMGVSERTVRRLCQGAKQRLRSLLGEGEGD